MSSLADEAVVNAQTGASIRAQQICNGSASRSWPHRKSPLYAGYINIVRYVYVSMLVMCPSVSISELRVSLLA